MANENKNNIYITTPSTNGNITVTKDASQYYANLAKSYAEDAQESATASRNSANSAEASKNNLLNNEGFQVVSDDLTGEDTIGTCAENMEAILNTPIQAEIATQQAQEAARQAEIATQQAEIAAQKAQEAGPSLITGQTIFSVDPLNEAGLHLLDGTLLPIGGIYDNFIQNYIVPLTTSNPERFTTDEQWQAEVSSTGVCNKYVYTADTGVRLPKFGNKLFTTPDVLNSATTAPVAGNGKALGLTDGTTNYGLIMTYASAATCLANNTNAYNKSVGTSSTVPALDASSRAVGVTTDAAKSGLVAKLTPSTLSQQPIVGYWYIAIGTVIKTEIEVDIDNIVTDLNKKADKDFDNCPVKPLLQTQITNCILEAPQMVDLELNDGVLTLKAGSKAIVPYGTSAPELNIGDPLNGGEIVDISWDGEKLFYIIEYDDLSLANTSEQNADFNLFVKADGSIGAIGSKAFYSSDTQPSTSGRYFWYDTTNNICKFYTGSELISYPSFPFVEIVNNSTGFASIKQVFQSIGFIGSTVWTNKGVKALAPNGKNEDGTLKNTEITSDYVFVNTTARNLANSKLRFYPTGLGMGITNYDNIDNVNRNNDGNIKANCALICAFDENQTLINNFTPKSVFQAVDNSMVEYKTFPTSNLKILDLNSPAVGSYQINLSNILPKDGYNYDLFVEMRCDTSNDTSVNDRVIRMFCSENDRTNSTNIIGYWCQDGTNQSFGCTQFIPLLYGARMLYLDISGTNSKTFANVDIDLLAYRKRGQ